MNTNWSIRNRFLVYGFLCLLPIAVLVAYLLQEIDDRSSQELISGEANVVSLVSSSVNTYVGSQFRALDTISNLPALFQDSPEDINAILGQARTFRADQAGLFVVNADGALMGSSGTDFELVRPHIESQITTTLTTGQRTVSSRVDLNLDEPTSVIVLMVPITTLAEMDSAAPTPTATPPGATNDDASQPQPTQAPTPAGTPGTRPAGTTLGVVGTVINIDNLNQYVIPSARPRTEIMILSDDQIITATGDLVERESEVIENLHAATSDLPDSSTDVFNIQGLSGTERIATYAPLQLENAEWAVLVTNPVPQAELQASWLRLVIILGLTAIAILAPAFVFGELTSRSLDEVVDSAQDLADGNYTKPITPRGSGEVLALGNALSTLQSRLQHRLTSDEQRQSERQRQTEQMRELLRRDLRMQEDERRHIASEIHDAVSPLITGALYQARALLMTNGGATKESVAETLDGVNTLLERASEELHEIIFDLRPPDLDDIGVVAAIEAFVSTIQRTGLETRLEVVNDPPPLTPEVRLGIYRIVQEALHNVLRHAGADEAVVRLEYAENVLRVTIRDNGTGFDPDKARRPTSLGLLSMRERAAAIDASLEILSRPGGGTAIILERKETGSIMSDELLDDLLRQRSEAQRVADETQSSDTTPTDDTTGTPEAEARRH